MAARKAGVWSFFLLLCLFSKGCRAASYFDWTTQLSLPEPNLVNAFLLNNYTDWTIPLLQVVKCQSRTSGISYDFYQVETPKGRCQYPPPLMTAREKQHVPSFKYWGTFAFACISVAIWTDIVTLVGGGAVIAFTVAILGCFVFGQLMDIRDRIINGPANHGSHLGGMQAGAASQQTRVIFDDPRENSPAGQSGEDQAEGLALQVEMGASISELKHSGEIAEDVQLEAHVTAQESAARQASCCREITGLLMASMLPFLVPAVLIITPRAMRELLPGWKVLPLGLVTLPDPSLGINQYLEAKNANVTLTLCTTKALSFYVGLPEGACGRLGDPYAGHVAPWEGQSPERSLLLTLVLVAMYATGAAALFVLACLLLFVLSLVPFAVEKTVNEVVRKWQGYEKKDGERGVDDFAEA